MRIPNVQPAHHCGSAFTHDGSAYLQDHDKVEVTPVDWERGIFHYVLIQHLLKISRVIHTIDFIL